MNEEDYHDLVRTWLYKNFENIYHEFYLPDSGRFVDFLVSTPFGGYVIEVEDTFEDVFDGIGQVTYYAAETGYEPVVVLPADDIDEPEFTYLQENTDIRFETI